MIRAANGFFQATTDTATDQWTAYRVKRLCMFPFRSSTWWLWQAEVEELLWSLGAWRSSAHDVNCKCVNTDLPWWIDKDGNRVEGPNLYA
jgi:hypothetical protein